MKHENVLKLYDYLKISNMIYLLLEYANKGNLYQHISSKGSLTDDQITSYFYQVCQAVNHVHSKGYVHRDIKPENIIIDPYYRLKLCDFGWCAHEKNYDFL